MGSRDEVLYKDGRSVQGRSTNLNLGSPNTYRPLFHENSRDIRPGYGLAELVVASDWFVVVAAR
jgi:hypothetical protein